MQIMVWRSRVLDNLRPPPRKELIAAWRSLMECKYKHKVPLNRTQAMQCRRLLQYLTKTGTSEQNVKLLTTADLALARRVILEIEPIERSREHYELAKAISAARSSGEVSGKTRDEELEWADLLRAMSRFGEAQAAAQDLFSKWDNSKYATHITGEDRGGGGEDRILDTVLQGLADEGAEGRLLELLEFSLERGVPYTPALQEIITVFFANRDRIPETKAWFTKPLFKGHSRPSVYHTVASFARRNHLQEWAIPFFQDLGQMQPRKHRWNALFRAVLLVGLPLEQVQTMMSHMVGESGPLSPDIDTINSLLKAAVELVDQELARSIVGIAETMDISPNEYTYLTLLDLHIASGSVANSEAAYQSLQDAGSIPLSASANIWAEYTTLLNKYLVLLGEQRPANFESIVKLLNTVEEDRVHLEPETVAALCLRFLENDQSFDVMDILAVHAFRYSEAQREVVQNAFVAFCLDKSTSTSRAWGAYQLLQQFFQDLSFERREELLRSFFERKRPDMATYVFGHMRQHRNRAYQPTLETYVQCFQGYTKNPDKEGTEMVHNMFKMDTRIQPNTRLYTALMLAFTACKLPLKALDVWSQIKQSLEGPSYTTLEGVFWTLEKKSGGHSEAREIWQKIEDMDLEVPLSVYNAYIGAIAASGNEKEVRGLIMKTVSAVGMEPDIMT